MVGHHKMTAIYIPDKYGGLISNIDCFEVVNCVSLPNGRWFFLT